MEICDIHVKNTKIGMEKKLLKITIILSSLWLFLERQHLRSLKKELKQAPQKSVEPLKILYNKIKIRVHLN